MGQPIRCISIFGKQDTTGTQTQDMAKTITISGLHDMPLSTYFMLSLSEWILIKYEKLLEI